MEMLQKVLSEVSEGIILMDKDNKVTFVNQVLLDLIGYEEADLLGKNINQLTKLHPYLKLLPETYNMSSVETENFTIMKKSVNIDKSSVIFIYDFKVQVEMQISELLDQNKELDAIINSLHDGIWVTDGEGRTVRLNQSSAEMVKVNREDMIGKTVFELEKQGVFSPSATVKSLLDKQPVTLMQNTRSGRRVVVTANPVFDEQGKLYRVVCNARDITEINNLLKKLEATERLVDRYREELSELRQERLQNEDVVMKSEALRNIMGTARRVAAVESSVLLLGESGVGKNVLAWHIHKNSPRREGPFIEINCGAIPENLMESEIFGYESGAFTGAKKEGKIGKIELADGGTLFLNEIGELSLELQVKLLQVLQERTITRIGGNDVIRVDFRLIAATNQDLSELASNGRFRKDLYYRLNVVPIAIPPLRERREGIPALVMHFVKKINSKYKMDKSITPGAMKLVLDYDWPGNIRELQNFIERVIVTTDEKDIREEHVNGILNLGAESSRPVTLKERLEEVEKDMLFRYMEKYQNTYKVADQLGVSQPTIVRKLKKYRKD